MKYFAKKFTIDGITYDSKKEYDVWIQLSLRERAGEISRLKRCESYLLLEGFKHHYAFEMKSTGLKQMAKQRDITYKPDFEYYENGKKVIVEVKSYGTKLARDYPLRRKLFLSQNLGVKFIEWY